VSSAYCTIGKSSSGCGIGAFRRFCSAALFIRIYSSSAARTKSSGDRGSLCLTPLLHLKDFPGTPLRRIVEDPELRISLIQLTHFCGKPMWVYHLYYDFMFNSVKSFFEVQL